LLAGLASQSAASGGFSTAVIAFATAAVTLVVMLIAGAVLMAGVSDSRFRDVRRQGPRVKRVGGVMLLSLGAWFGFLAVADPIYLLP